jgi:hypothetical protein
VGNGSLAGVFVSGSRNHDIAERNRGIESAYPSFCTLDSKDAMGIDLSPLHANASSSLVRQSSSQAAFPFLRPRYFRI